MKSKLGEIEILRGIAAILVVLIHISATPLVTLENVKYFLLFDIVSSFSKCAVYTFIFISGLLLMHKYVDQDIKYFDFIRKRGIKVLVPYVVWSTLYYGYFIVNGFYKFDLVFYIKNIIAGGHLYHLYFVVIILQFYLLFPLFKHLVKKFDFKILLPISLTVNILFTLVQIPLKDRIFVSYLCVFMIGCYAGKNLKVFLEYINKYKILLVTGFLSVLIVFNYAQYVLFFKKAVFEPLTFTVLFIAVGILGALFYLYISCVINEKTQFLNNALKEISKGSFYIYLAHPLIILVVEQALANYLNIGVLQISFISLVGIIVTVFPLSILYNRLKSKIVFNKING